MIENELNEYVEKIENVSNFFDYFNGYDDEETGEWIYPEGDIYNVDWTIRGWNCPKDELEYVGVEVQTGFGGPSFWIDTIKGVATISWGFEVIEKKLSRKTIDLIDDYFEDYFLNVMM